MSSLAVPSAHHSNDIIQLTVGKMEAGLAVLLTPDLQVIEFPSSLLPEGCHRGSIVNISLLRNIDKEKECKEYFKKIQTEISQEYGQLPKTPLLSVSHVTQTTLAVRWEPLELHCCELRGIDCFVNGSKVSSFIMQNSNTLKLSGLDMDKAFEVYIVVRTSGGAFKSNVVLVRTHTIDNMSGLSVYISPTIEEGTVRELKEIMSRLGGKITTELNQSSVTHFVTNLAQGEEYEKANNWNIPIVNADWLKECAANKKMLSVSQYYLKL